MSTTGRKKPRRVVDTRRKKSKPKKSGWLRRKPAPKRQSRRAAGPLMRLWRWLGRLVWGLTWRIAAILAVIVGIAVFYDYTTLPDARTLLDGRARGSVTLKDRYGKTFAWRGDQFGGVVTADTVSPYLKDAVIATEDRRFYHHFGISPRGIAGAIYINLSEGRGPLSGNGGSTITQQTAKLLCMGVKYDPDHWKSRKQYVLDCRRTTLWRKVKEAVFALAMEAKYTKDEILSIYLNRAYMGAGAYGAEAASQRYFGKHAAELTPQEAAILAGLLTAPTRLAPTTNLKRSQERAATVLRLMAEQGYLTEAEARAAQKNPATLSEAATARIGGYFADWVMNAAPDFLIRDTTEDVIIKTTFDKRIQRAAEEAMKTVFADKVKKGSKAQAAIVVMSADGAVRAMVGGRDTTVVGAFNRATMARRQTGSAFKPFVYAAALDLGYTPDSTVVDEPYCLDVPGSGRWCPQNYEHKHYGRITLTEALARSINVPAVRVAQAVGLDRVRKVAADFGIDSDLAKGPALALGVSESTLLEMTGAYAGILNGGSSVKPYGLVELRLQGEGEPLMGAGGGIGERVIGEDAARELIYMMSQVIEKGTGRRARLPDREAAGKTGTTQAARDAWFLGFTADYVAGVWMGYDDNSPLSGVTGGGLPAEIWRETMTRVHEGLKPRPLPMIRPKQTREEPGAMNPERTRQRPGNAVERILRDLLGNGLR